MATQADADYDSLPDPASPDGIALAKIRVQVRDAVYPTLSVSDLLELLRLSKRADGSGLSIRDPNWTPTYNINAACIEGWEMKAANVSGSYDIGDSDQKLTRHQAFDMCSKQAGKFRKREYGSVVVLAPQRSGVTIASPLDGVTVLPSEQQQNNSV